MTTVQEIVKTLDKNIPWIKSVNESIGCVDLAAIGPFVVIHTVEKRYSCLDELCYVLYNHNSDGSVAPLPILPIGIKVSKRRGK